MISGRMRRTGRGKKICCVYRQEISVATRIYLQNIKCDNKNDKNINKILTFKNDR